LFVPPERKVQLILDALDFPDSLQATGEAQRPSWGLQVFNGAQMFVTPRWAGLFQQVVNRVRAQLTG